MLPWSVFIVVVVVVVVSSFCGAVVRFALIALNVLLDESSLGPGHLFFNQSRIIIF